jgi:hypothetical protein
MRPIVSSAIKTPSLYLWVVLQRQLHRPAQAEQLEYFHTRDLRASTNTETTAAFTNQNMSATRINHIPMGKIIGYYGSLDHNKVVQRREDAALTNPIAQHRITLGISISP